MMLKLIMVRSKYNKEYVIEVVTKTIPTHALLTDYPEVWKAIEDAIRKELETIVKIDELAR